MQKDLAKSARRIVLYSLMLFLSISLIFISIVIVVQVQSNRANKADLIENETNIVALEAKTIEKNLNGLFSDVMYLAYTFRSNGDSKYEQLKENWSTYLDSKRFYFKIRYIDINGDERIRINYSPDGSYASAADELQNKKDRYYFQETIGLSNNQIYTRF